MNRVFTNEEIDIIAATYNVIADLTHVGLSEAIDAGLEIHPVLDGRWKRLHEGSKDELIDAVRKELG